MNYLAHFLLSNNDDGLIIGNYIADEVRGKDYLNYPEDVMKGILLHRKIDDFTDKHPTVIKSKDRIRKIHKKYTPVIVDVYYDYFLANNWGNYSQEDLKKFTQGIYLTLFKNLKHIPAKSKIKLGFMANGDWLYNYKNLQGIERTLGGLSRRTKFENTMHKAHIELDDLRLEFDEDFNSFFPELKNYTLLELEKGM